MAETLPKLLLEKAERYPEVARQYSRNGDGSFKPISNAEFVQLVKRAHAGFKALGVSRGDRVGLISDNRKEWFQTDFALLSAGAIDVPRGCDATEQEIAYILSFSGCVVTVLENRKQLDKVLSSKAKIPSLRTVVLFEGLDDEARAKASSAGLTALSFDELMASGEAELARRPDAFETDVAAGKRDDVVTLIYTSGTTGEPKGVMLTHGNFLHQTDYLPTILPIKPGEIWLSVLPVWHSFERLVEYAAVDTVSSIAYSKPIGSVMLADFVDVKPHWMASVPRIWESVKDGVYRNIRAQGGIKKALFSFFVGVGELYAKARNRVLWRVPRFIGFPRLLDSLIWLPLMLLVAPLRALGWLLVFKKIQAKLGGRFVAGISGGGALPSAIDSFFDALGVRLLEGYGLTETAPVLCVRALKRPIVHTVGKPLRGTEIRIVGDSGDVLGPGRKGVVYARGGQIMKGYYEKPELTRACLAADGWLNTGDIGMLTVDGELKLTGRAKDTIVLRGGENVEPAPIEQKLCESDYIEQAVVVGQDQKYLAALLVPSQELVSSWARENNVPIVDYESLLQQPEVRELIDYEINELVNQRNGFKSFERIYRFILLPSKLEVGRELSHKQEVMRHKFADLYAKEIRRLFEE
jgi:long-chain acyl-CoA synthetase